MAKRIINPELQNQYWPPVISTTGNHSLYTFLNSSLQEKRSLLLELKKSGADDYDEFLNNTLSTVYAYMFGYRDSLCYLTVDEELELQLAEARIVLEDEFVKDYQNSYSHMEFGNQVELVKYLRDLILNSTTNSGVFHPFYDFLESEAPLEHMKEFLMIEVIRNEVIDDEIAHLVVGLQGLMKNVIVSNLWDESGNGELTEVHTYWLRLILDKLDIEKEFKIYRKTTFPWFAKISSNCSNINFIRPGYKYRGYGSFLITEGWVLPHFRKIVSGLNRVGLNNPELQKYFTEHIRIDPFHTNEMLQGILHQVPALSTRALNEVAVGAHMAVAAGTRMYDRLLSYFTSK